MLLFQRIQVRTLAPTSSGGGSQPPIIPVPPIKCLLLTSIDTYKCASEDIHTCTCTNTKTKIDTCRCVRTHINIQVHARTHTHTQTMIDIYRYVNEDTYTDIQN